MIEGNEASNIEVRLRLVGPVLDPIRTAFEAPELHIGALRGLVAAAVAGGLALIAVWLRSAVGRRWLRRLRIRASPSRLPGLVGPAFVVAAMLALDALQGSLSPMVKAGGNIPAVPIGVFLGLALVWLGVAIAGLTPAPLPTGMILALPGAWRLVAGETFFGPSWVPWVIVLCTAVLGPLAAETDRDLGRLGLGPLMWLITIGAVYSTVPDTELILVLLGVALPLALLGIPFRLARLGEGGSAAAIGLMLWVAAQGGWARPGSIVGSVGALALFATIPIGRRLRVWFRFELGWNRTSRALGILTAQLILAMWASRIAGMAYGAGEAFIRLLPALAAGVFVGMALPLGRRRILGSSRKHTPDIARDSARDSAAI